MLHLSFVTGTATASPHKAYIVRDLTVPANIKDTYQVEEDQAGFRVLGRGRFSTVYLGRHMQNDQKVAVKVMDPFEDSNKNGANVALREKIPLRFKHPNIVTILDTAHFRSAKPGEETKFNVWMIIMTFCQFTLPSFFKKLKPPKEGRLNILRQLSGAISYLHNRKFIHRDLKPDNVLMLEEGGDHLLKLCDFSLAEHLASKESMLSQKVGTLHWMAPEQFIEPIKYSFPADIFAAGHIMAAVMVAAWGGSACSDPACPVCTSLVVYRGMYLISSTNSC